MCTYVTAIGSILSFILMPLFFMGTSRDVICAVHLSISTRQCPDAPGTWCYVVMGKFENCTRDDVLLFSTDTLSLAQQFLKSAAPVLVVSEPSLSVGPFIYWTIFLALGAITGQLIRPLVRAAIDRRYGTTVATDELVSTPRSPPLSDADKVGDLL